MRRLVAAALLLVASLTYADSGPAMPDPVLTPGARDPRVTQATIYKTICLAGWAKKVRPAAGAAHRYKLRALKRYHIAARDIIYYEADHLIPLELGGHPVMQENLWPQLWEEARKKDRAENWLHQQVCKGRISLEEAREMMATRWVQAYIRAEIVR